MIRFRQQICWEDRSMMGRQASPERLSYDFRLNDHVEKNGSHNANHPNHDNSCTQTATSKSIASKDVNNRLWSSGASQRLEPLARSLAQAVLRGLGGSCKARLANDHDRRTVDRRSRPPGLYFPTSCPDNDFSANTMLAGSNRLETPLMCSRMSGP